MHCAQRMGLIFSERSSLAGHLDCRPKSLLVITHAIAKPRLQE